ncbi:unnamed protein product [Arabis nemorensis]|uniref:Uncharacterized protein n=1 Tax=Arabis nemorensis TaxID=586526 RepID=A0A565B4F6_9BRAS|nr:unnamed protein product [Arabis nemorensis]
MHSFGYRAKRSAHFRRHGARIHLRNRILNINRFKKQSHGNDEVSLTLDIAADLQSLFNLEHQTEDHKLERT